MRQELESLIATWQLEAGSARPMGADNLKKLNKYLAMELESVWHNSQCAFIVGKEEAELFEKRTAMTNGQVQEIGRIELAEYNQLVVMYSLRDHPYLGELLRRASDAKDVESVDVIEDDFDGNTD